jgi:hypothetical protein
VGGAELELGAQTVDGPEGEGAEVVAVESL